MCIISVLCLFLFVVGCGNNSTKTYEVIDSSFTAKHLQNVEKCIGIKFPPNSHGLRLLFKGDQIDASLVARISVPNNSTDFFIDQIKIFPPSKESVSPSLTNTVNWWSAGAETLVADRRFIVNHNHHELVHFLITSRNGNLYFNVEWYQ